MRFRTCVALLLVLPACATTEPHKQMALPWTPLVAPKPLAPVLPAPVGLTPPAPVMVDPNAQPRQEPATQPQGDGSRRGPPAPVTSGRRRPECAPIPKPHLGGDALHDWCADTFPPNHYPGMDVLVDGKRFDALQVGVPVLWEIKTDRFDTYNAFLRNQVVIKQLDELQRERELAEACGYGFVVGVSSAAHRTALLKLDPTLDIVVTGC
ncbi:DUF6310 domain-containing protein [Myxococcus sp. RHSTA-1-4]|uniref:DUF6310 domain-containing protein n=1 Tax=Myxococcus sp. RHSTA-1-4 TaxID=2874601 RepID=UPI001CBA80D5|nr:DUF6310 domain-containing protein [Myxococcus sp. RHSTA-1-4]MBZ4415364.1 DUF6310 domain-containing protein [Myxococcus sp. RHSTA-1-4]